MPEQQPSGSTAHESTFTDAEGVEIHTYRWDADRPRGVIELLHGLGEYATRYEPLARDLVAAGWTVRALDYRGHGATGMGQWGGDAAKLGRLGPGGVRATLAGIRRFTNELRAEHAGLPLVLLGHSMGSLFAQKLLQEDATPWDGVVLSGTAYRTFRHMNSGDLNKPFHRPGGTGAEWLSRDPGVAVAFGADPLTFDAKTIKLYGLLDALRLLGTPRAMTHDLPMLIQIGSDDTLGGPRSIERLAAAYRDRAHLTDVVVKIYDGARHEVYNEINRVQIVADLVDWLNAHITTPTRS
jgi:alpha-beta hydrolase superfamily lysophospholipase